MQKNVGKVDQAIRYIIAIILVVATVFLQDVHAAWLLLLVPAVVLGVTAAVSWCGLYKVLGIDTCRFDK